MKKKLINIVIILLFTASIIIACTPKKVQKDQKVETDKVEKITGPSMSYEEFEKKLKELNNLLEKELITKDEYYKMRKKLLEEY